MKTFTSIILLSVTTQLFALDSLQIQKLGDSLYNEGKITFGKAQYGKAVELWLATLKTGAKTEEALNGLGCVYVQLEKHKAAISYFEKVYNKAHGKMKGCSAGNLGTCYKKLGNKTLAEKYLKESIIIFKEIKDTSRLVTALSNLGYFYNHIEQYDEALKVLFEEKTLSKTYSTALLLNIGAAYYGKENYSLAITYCESSLKTIDSNSLYTKITENCYRILSEVYEKSDNYVSALQFYKKYKKTHDTIFNTENFKNINQLQEQFESEQKESQIKDLEQTKTIQELANNRSSLINKVSLVIILLGILILVLAYYSYKKIKAAKKIIEHKNKDITDSINYAKGIQQTILPILPSNAQVLFQPKDIVSGDFYWSKEIGLNKYYAVADCTGHGVPGALLSMLCNELLNTAVTLSTYPNEILQHVNNELKKRMEVLGRQDGMEISLIHHNIKTSETTYTGANRTMFLVRNNETITYTPTKHGIGGNTEYNQKFELKTIDIKEGDKIYLTTDGFIDQFGHNGKKYGSKQFKTSLSLSAPSVDELKSNLDTWMGNEEQIDDICVMIINF